MTSPSKRAIFVLAFLSAASMGVSGAAADSREEAIKKWCKLQNAEEKIIKEEVWRFGRNPAEQFWPGDVVVLPGPALFERLSNHEGIWLKKGDKFTVTKRTLKGLRIMYEVDAKGVKGMIHPNSMVEDFLTADQVFAHVARAEAFSDKEWEKAAIKIFGSLESHMAAEEMRIKENWKCG